MLMHATHHYSMTQLDLPHHSHSLTPLPPCKRRTDGVEGSQVDRLQLVVVLDANRLVNHPEARQRDRLKVVVILNKKRMIRPRQFPERESKGEQKRQGKGGLKKKGLNAPIG